MKTNDSWKLQIRKGLFEVLILSFLDKKAMYGYEINSSINTIPEFEIANGTVYPILQRLLKNEWVTTYLGESSNGPKRKYYQITAEGRSVLKSRLGFYESVTNVLHSLDSKEFYNGQK